jgi:tryptophanyl-tRNA synthetase
MIPTIGAKIRDLQNPEQKMSKSTTNPKASVFLSDTEKQIRKKIMSAVTDSDGIIKFDEENKPGVSNLLTIYSAFTGCTIEDSVAKFEGGGYGDLKKAVAEVLVERLGAFQEKYNEILASGRINDILDAGRDYSNKIAAEKYELVRKAVGFGRI